MPIFQTVRRTKRWPVRLPLHDGRECPDCGALVIGDKGQDDHRAYHEAMRDWQDSVTEAIRQTAIGAGLTVGCGDDSAGEYHGLDVNDDELHDSKRRRVPWRTLVTNAMQEDEDDG